MNHEILLATTTEHHVHGHQLHFVITVPLITLSLIRVKDIHSLKIKIMSKVYGTNSNLVAII